MTKGRAFFLLLWLACFVLMGVLAMKREPALGVILIFCGFLGFAYMPPR